MFYLRIVGPWMQQGGGLVDGVNTERLICLDCNKKENALKKATKVLKEHKDSVKGQDTLYHVEVLEINQVIDFKDEYKKVIRNWKGTPLPARLNRRYGDR